MIFPTVNVLSFEHGKRTRLTIIWLKMVMIALGGLLAYIAVSFSFCFSAALEDGAVFAAAALVGLFLAIWHSYRLRLVDAIWTFMTYALFHFLFLAGLGPDWITR
jgi:hypothetical protein